jgi:hypothetical protein
VKKVLFSLMMLCLLSIAASAQTSIPDFSGTWQLDKEKSTLSPVFNMFEGVTLKVTQSKKELKTENLPKISGRPASMRGELITYKLDGKETVAEIEAGNLTGKNVTSATTEGGNLSLKVVKTGKMAQGEFTSTIRETWELQSDGLLKIKRENENARGTTSEELVFVKKGK